MELKRSFSGKTFTRKEVLARFGIDNNTWKRLYDKGKKDKVMKFHDRYWKICIGHGSEDQV